MGLAGQGNPIRGECGYAMAALLVGLSVMSVLMSMALPVWSHMVKRDKEEELIWRGKQYARAVGLFQRKYANTFPPTLDILVEQKFLRKKYKDPITNDDFQLVPANGGTPTPGQPLDRTRSTSPQASTAGGAGSVARGQSPGQANAPTVAIAGAGNINVGIAGVVSKSKDSSIKIYNGRQKYNEWVFVYMQTAQQIGPGGIRAPGAGAPFGTPGRGMPGGGPFGPGGSGVPGGRGPGFPGAPQGPGFPGGRGFQPTNPGGNPQMPFGQPGQSPFQPGQQPPFGQPGQQPTFGQPFGQPPGGQPFGVPQPQGRSTRPPGN